MGRFGDNEPYRLTWEERLQISIDAGNGLDFLHRDVEPNVIHRDIKDSNILLGNNLRAKISDFGLAKLARKTSDSQIPSVSITQMKWTFGYLCPEYVSTQNLNVRIDVYAFGVVLLVLLSGRPALDVKAVGDKRNLSEWATKCIAEKRVDLIMDQYLVGKISPESLQQFLKVAQKCLCRPSELRPTMEEVISGLQLALKEQPTIPGTSSRRPGRRLRLTKMIEEKLKAKMRVKHPAMIAFSLDEIKEATNDFDEALIIGKGRFGLVNLGLINNGAKFVAIKRLSSESHQGDTEFVREIQRLSHLSHRNLVRLKGYCKESPEKILVYEYMPNGSLADHLYKNRGSVAGTGYNETYPLTWKERLQISIDAGKGLDFLHRDVQPNVIHCDIKDSNILLGNILRAKISDFGLAKLAGKTSDPQITSDSRTKMKCTSGYMAPEYVSTQKLTTQTDVYAFGVVLLVVLCGRPAVDNTGVGDQQSLAAWAIKCIVEKKVDLIIDPYLVGKISSKSLQLFVKIAQKCLSRQSELRPMMEEVVADLQLALTEQSTPGASSSFPQMIKAKFKTLMTGKRPEMNENKEFLEDIVRRLLEGEGGKTVQLLEEEIELLCTSAQEIFLSQPNFLELGTPINICGDIYGQYKDLLRIFKLVGFPSSVSYLFLGNYLGQGKQSLETICLLLAYKILYPENVFLLRGNHEDSKISRINGFYDECKKRYNESVWKVFTDCFSFLPVAALVDEKIFCVHGGLSPKLQNTEQINEISRPTDIPDVGILCDLLWSDPDPKIKGWGINDRGVSYTFGADIVAEFLQNNDLDLICRGHQVVKDGYELFADRGLVTICSAPNYCGEFDNAGAVLSVDESMMCSFPRLEPIFYTKDAARKTYLRNALRRQP